LAERDPQDLFAKGCLMDNLKNIFLERMPAAEMEENLVIEADAALSNRRNGSSKKSMLTEQHFFTLQLTCCAMAA
jgi:transposase-like protein